MAEKPPEGLLLDDREVVLNDVVASLSMAAATHRHGAERLGDAPAAAGLTELARKRAAQCDALMETMAASGLRPHAPSPDREAVGLVWRMAQALLSADEAAELVAESEAEERGVAEAVEAALAFDHEPEIRRLLAEVEGRTPAGG